MSGSHNIHICLRNSYAARSPGSTRTSSSPAGRDNIGNPDYRSEERDVARAAPRHAHARRALREAAGQPLGRLGPGPVAVPRGACEHTATGASRARTCRTRARRLRAHLASSWGARTSHRQRGLLALGGTSAFPGVLVRGAARGRGLCESRVPAAAGVGRRRAGVPIGWQTRRRGTRHGA